MPPSKTKKAERLEIALTLACHDTGNHGSCPYDAFDWCPHSGEGECDDIGGCFEAWYLKQADEAIEANGAYLVPAAFRMSHEQNDQLWDLAQKTKRSMSDLIREGVDAVLRDKEG